MSPLGVAVGDFNGDGIADLAVANFSSNDVSILLGDGSGGFAPAPGSPVAVGDGPYGVAVGDFNGDGIADLAVANNSATTVNILLNQVTQTATAVLHRGEDRRQWDAPCQRNLSRRHELQQQHLANDSTDGDAGGDDDDAGAFDGRHRLRNSGHFDSQRDAARQTA